MNTAQVYIQPYVGEIKKDTPSVPVFIPDLDDVRQFSAALHARGESWEGVVFGWPARYLPEIDEPAAEFEIYDEKGMMHLEKRRHRSPAYFSIGIEGVWHFARLWEYGAMQEPEETIHSHLARA